MSMFDPRVPSGAPPDAPLLFNEFSSTFELSRNNINGGTVLASAVRSATITSAALTNLNWRGATFFVNITAVPGSGSATVAVVIQGQDPVAGGWVELVRSQDRSASFAVTVYPGTVSESATNRISAALPRDIRILGAVSAGATSKDVTFSIGMEWIL